MQIEMVPLLSKVLIYLHCADSPSPDTQLLIGKVRGAGITNYGLEMRRHCTCMFHYT